jgi:hypothetical protein
VKRTVLFFALAAVIGVIEGSELNRESVFDSVDGFVTALKAFQPVATKAN